MTFISVLKQTDILFELTITQLELVASICTEQIFNAGNVIFEENTPGTELYIIASGAVDIQVIASNAPRGQSDEGVHTIATLRRGQSFGEVSLVDQGVRSARARCAQNDTHLLSIPHSKLIFLCDCYPQLGYRLMRNLAADLAMKIRNTDMQVQEYLTWNPRG
jgi:CRP-like cAMP-binding protein